jgi:hypothetical protein
MEVPGPLRLSDRSGSVRCSLMNSMNRIPFETMSKRRRGYPSETQVRRGVRIVHGDKYRLRSAFEIRTLPAVVASSAIHVPAESTRIV